MEWPVPALPSASEHISVPLPWACCRDAMISSGDFASLEATLRNSDVASRHYSHAIQYRAGSRHFWPPTPPPDGRYGAAGNGRPPSVMMPADLYFDHLHHHKSYLATPPPLDSAGHPSAFSMYGGGMPPKSDPRREIKRYPLPPAPSSKPVPIHHHPQQQQQPPPQHHYRHPSVIVKQEVAEEPVQPTNLVVKSSRLPNKFIHSIQNSPFSPPTSQSALSSLQTLVEQNGCPKLKHAPPVGCVLPMPSNPRPEPKKFPCSADGNIPIGIAHAHQRPKDLSCDQIDANPSPLKSHLLSKPPQQPMGLMREFKDECLEKSPYPSSYPGVPSHHSSGVLPPGTRWPWLPPVWPPAPEGCQLVKDPRTGQLLLLEAAGSYALMGPPTTSSHMWTPVPPPGGTSCCDIKAGIPKLEEEKKAEEPLAIIKKEAPPTPSPPAKPEQEEVIDLTVSLKEEEPPPLQPAPPAPPPPEAVEPPATDGLQLLLDGIELKKPSPSNFELLCSYAHEVFEKEQMTTPPSRVVHKSEVAKKVQSLTAPGNPPVVEPDPTEVKIRQQLADLQRKYQENQRGLAELVPKKKTSKHKPNRPKKTICALEPVPTTTTTTPTIPVPTKAAVKQPVEVDQEIDVPLSRLRQVAKPDDKKPPSKLKRTLSGSTFALPRPKKSSTPSSASSSSSSGSPKKSQPTDSSSPSTESESSPKKELKPKPINVKNEKGQKSLQLVRKRKFFRSRRHSRSETSEPPVEKVSRNLITKLEANENSGDEEEVSEESFEKKRLRTKSEKKTETAKSRLSKTQASLSIRKQMGQQQKTTPEKKDKQAVVKRTRLSLVKRQSSSRSQRSAGDDSSDFSPDSTPVKRGLRKEEDACLLRDQDMVENARVLVLEDGLLYPGVIIDIQPPKVGRRYGVMLDGGRGTSPRLFSRDELGRQAVQEVQPSKLLPEGSRVCAYWSQHYQCLYPGVVSKGDNAGGSPDGKTMFVQFDDGDSGKIPLSDIRLLASHITDPSRSPSPEPAESPRSLRKKKQQQAGKPAEKKKKASVIRPSLRLRLSRALRQRSSPGYHHFYHRSRMAAVTPKPEKQSPTKNETKATTENLWRWCGKPVRKIGAKGKTKREYFKAIIRKNEKIVLGECVAFCGRNSPHVGQVQNLWQTCSGGSMVVRVRWFYLPQELKNSTPHLPKGGLYQTSHEEDSDVQAISHKCQVIPYEEFCQRPSTDSMYYLAGEYDLASGAVSARVS